MASPDANDPLLNQPPPPPTAAPPRSGSSGGPAPHPGMSAQSSGQPFNPADPSTWPRVFSQYASKGGALTAEEAQLLEDEYSAGAQRELVGGKGYNPYGGGYMSGLSGFRFPADVSPDQMKLMLDKVSAWTASVGWQFFPSARSFMDLMKQGPMTDQEMGKWLFSRLPAGDQAKLPWAQYGLDKNAYTQTLRQYNETASSLLGTDFTGSGLDQSMLQTALDQNWSTARWSQALQNDPAARSKYGWIRHGMDYQGFQKYLTDNKQTLEKRYGMGQGTSANALSDLDNPLVGFGSYAGAISFESPKSPLMSTSQSAVR